MIRLTPEGKAADDSSYIKHAFANLNEIKKRICLLILDEVYEEATFQYHGEIIFWKVVDKPHILANAILGFNILTLFGDPKSYAICWPCDNLTQNLYLNKQI